MDAGIDDSSSAVLESALDSRKGNLPFSALDLIPLVGEIGLVQPKLTLGQFFDFRFGVNAGGLFNLPHPIQAQRELRDPGLWAFGL